MSESYSLVLQCLLPYREMNEDGEEVIVRYDNYDIEFDVIDFPVNVSLSSDVTTHPLVNGDMIADHMYKNPASVSFSGAFSLYGNKPSPFEGESSDRLTNIETFFERLKNEGIHCTLTRFASGSDSSVRFIQRKNMVLTGITWKEELSYLGFDFTFAQVLVANVQEVEYDIDVTDPNLPALTDAATLDFTDTLLDWDQVDRVIFAICGEYGIVAEDFWNVIVDVVSSQNIGAIVGAGAGVAAGVAVCLTIGLSSLSVPVVGWIVAGCAAVGAIVGGLIGLFQSIKRETDRLKYKVETFKNYNDDQKNRQEVERFCNWIGQIHMNLETLEDVLHVYAVSSNEPQECMLYLDDYYYIFKFEKNNTTGDWSLVVTSPEENNIEVGRMDKLVGKRNIGECKDDKTSYLFRVAGSGAWVYVINLKLEAMIAQGKSQAEIDEMSRDLRNYAILKSDVNLDNFNEMLEKVIDDAMTM